MPRLENIMNKIAIFLAVGASALFVTAASAAPLTANRPAVSDSDIQNVRMVCDQSGQCWRQGGVRRSYGYAAPRGRYAQRRGYGERGGIGIRAPGVSVGIGSGRY
jgi:hypothetical protein